MAKQVGVTRTYSSTKEEAGNPNLTSCPLCKVISIPRGIVTTKKVSGTFTPKEGKHCPNCGHVYGRGI